MTTQRANVLLFVILLGLVASLGLALFQNWRASQAQVTTINHLKQIALAIHGFNDAYKRLPPAFDRFRDAIPSFSLHVHLLPFVEQEELYKGYLIEGQGNPAAYVSAYHAPSDRSCTAPAGVQNFAANLRLFSKKGLDTEWDLNMPSLAAVEPGSGQSLGRIRDGTSNTIAFATKLAVCGEGGSRYAADPASPWAAFFGQNAGWDPPHPSNPRSIYQLGPRGEECLTNPLMAQSFNRKGLEVAMADATVRYTLPTITVEAWNMALHPCDGRIGPSDWTH